VAGPQYTASGIHQFLFGHDYRRLWTTPVELPVLDLGTFASGLTPAKRSGGKETKALQLEGGDGRRYTFRSVDKDPSSVIPQDLQGTIAERLVQDQIAALHPAAAVVEDALLEAAGVLHPDHQMVVMPDDPRLGEFRQDFAGLVGTIEERPEGSDKSPGFHGATDVIAHEEAYHRFEESPDDRPDSRALLRARLMDVLAGDWDRHRNQWRWAKLPDVADWQPISLDRDLAFSRFEGVVLGMARDREPRFLAFSEDYPGIEGLVDNGSEQDRVILVDLEWPVWEETARSLQASLSDAVIDAAVRRMPAEYYRLDGARLAAALRKRRDGLVEIARRFYAYLAHEVDVHATNGSERAEVVRQENGDVEVRVARSERGAAPYYDRTFHPGETDEIRLYMRQGVNSVVVRGHPGRIKVRVIGGEGSDRVDDSQGGGTHVYDSSGEDRVVRGPGTKVDRRPYTPPPSNPEAPWIPARDFRSDTVGSPWFGGGPDIGVFLGFGLRRDGYGFRKDPYSSRQLLRAGFATEAVAFRADYAGEFRRTNSGVYTTLAARASGIEVLNFYGFGNQTASTVTSEYHRVKQQQYSFAPSLSVPLASRLRFSIGPVVRFATIDAGANEGRFILAERPYGSGDFGEVGATAGLRLDTTREPIPRHGFVLDAGGAYYPKLWDVASGFGEVHGVASAYISGGGALAPTLALRAGGKRVWGRYPFFEAAFLGGTDSVRGLRAQRFAGDASLYASAELRLRLTDFFFVLPGEMGVLALADVGRVYLEGESSRKWHSAAGGGLWFSVLDRTRMISVAVAQSEERTGVYLWVGFAF
jgi:hypothetical protein